MPNQNSMTFDRLRARCRALHTYLIGIGESLDEDDDDQLREYLVGALGTSDSIERILDNLQKEADALSGTGT